MKNVSGIYTKMTELNQVFLAPKLSYVIQCPFPNTAQLIVKSNQVALLPKGKKLFSFCKASTTNDDN